MSECKVIIVTGASSGFGALTVRALADANHVVYAGMRDTAGRNAESAAAASRYADEHGVTLRAVDMDVSEWTYPIRTRSTARSPRSCRRQAGSTW